MDTQTQPNRKIRTLKLGEEKKHLELLNLCHNPWGDEQRWRRMYLQEAFDITKNVLVVEENGEWAGGVTAWFRDVFLAKEKTVKTYVAGDGYVLPSQRGKGLYSFYMRAVNEMAKERGATLGFGFISAYNLPPLKALPKIGFTEALFPVTKILVLNPERFLHYIITEWTREFQIPREFEGMKFVITISFRTYKEKVTLCKRFTVKNGKLVEPSAISPSKAVKERIDLRIATDMETLTKIASEFNGGKRRLFFALLASLLKRRISLRFSFRLFKVMMRL